MESKNIYDITIPFNKNLNNDNDSYLIIIKLYHTIYSKKNKSILLDFNGVEFLSANLLALLGCCVDNTLKKCNNRLAIRNLNSKIKAVMQKNGFNRYFHWEDLKDTYHSTMDYAIFKTNTDNLEEFERYLLINVFSRQDLPIMMPGFKNRIIDDFLEIFNNVIDHTNSSSVYVCGQYFHKSHILSFSIVDLGETINKNVTTYLSKHGAEIPKNTLEWAILPGNSTKSESAPGGLGLSNLIEFIKLNKGSFILISDKEVYEINKGKERFRHIDLDFPGTIVTISINLEDNQLYFLDKEQNNIIVF